MKNVHSPKEPVLVVVSRAGRDFESGLKLLLWVQARIGNPPVHRDQFGSPNKSVEAMWHGGD